MGDYVLFTCLLPMHKANVPGTRCLPSKCMENGMKGPSEELWGETPSVLEVLPSSLPPPAQRATHLSKFLVTALPFYKFLSDLSLKQTLLFSKSYFSVFICPFLSIWVYWSNPLLYAIFFFFFGAYRVDLNTDMMRISLENQWCLLYLAPKS